MQYCKYCKQMVKPKRYVNPTTLLLLIIISCVTLGFGLIGLILFFLTRDKACPICHTKAFGQQWQASLIDNQKEENYCPNCGSTLKESVKFCQNCGTKI